MAPEMSKPNLNPSDFDPFLCDLQLPQKTHKITDDIETLQQQNTSTTLKKKASFIDEIDDFIEHNGNYYA